MQPEATTQHHAHKVGAAAAGAALLGAGLLVSALIIWQNELAPDGLLLMSVGGALLVGAGFTAFVGLMVFLNYADAEKQKSADELHDAVEAATAQLQRAADELSVANASRLNEYEKPYQS